jgi:microcystin-dependent protein
MDPFVAEIRIFGFNFPPTGWAACDGQLLPISQNTALFSLLGTNYGGDGKSNFALPDLQDRAPISQGQGPGLSDRFIGESGGQQTVTLEESEMPLHTHFARASNDVATSTQPANDRLFAVGDAIGFYNTNSQPITTMAPQTLTITGSSVPHNNMQPFLTFQFCIAMQGVFPQSE